MKRALLVGIDDYEGTKLTGCVEAVRKLDKLLSQNYDGSRNFDCRSLISPYPIITRMELIENITQLLDAPSDLAIFYFSGHGAAFEEGGYLLTQDARAYSDGVSVRDLVHVANRSSSKEIFIILDCCLSVQMGTGANLHGKFPELREGISILAANNLQEVQVDELRSGKPVVFNELICEALVGKGSDISGEVTVASLYHYIDSRLRILNQSPILKSHTTSRSSSIRKTAPKIAWRELRLLNTLFPTEDFEFRLDPSFEPTTEPRNPINEESFMLLQKYRTLDLVEPVGEEHLYFAAINCKPVRLTHLGRLYWKLIRSNQI